MGKVEWGDCSVRLLATMKYFHIGVDEGFRAMFLIC